MSLQIEKIWKYRMGDLAIALTQGSPYVPFLRHVIYDIIEKGQLHKIKQKWTIPDPDCAPLRQTVKPLSLKKLSSLFIFIMSGFILAILSFLFEFIFDHFVPKSSRKTFHNDTKIYKLKMNLKELRKISIDSNTKYLLPLIEESEKLVEECQLFEFHSME